MTAGSPAIPLQEPAVVPHPCFHPKAAAKHGRIHLPIAPDCNIQCRYCNRAYDCANESRPGVTSALLGPLEAADYLDEILTRMPWISVAGIAGPGDAFADPLRTLASLEYIRRRHPDLHLCLSTNGLALYEHISALAELRVGFVTVTVNAVDPLIGAKVYSSISWKNKKVAGTDAAALLLDRQLAAIARLKARQIAVKVNTVVIPGINIDHIPHIARIMAGLKVDLHNLIALIPVPKTPLAWLKPPSRELMASLRRTAGRYLPQMRHCMRCRADAVGLLSPSPPLPQPARSPCISQQSLSAGS
ncbi:MAG: radical SAM protein [Desulforhopalus sp.]|nr:radical SAM protein [Desulforhopalus sp.]